MPARNPSVGNHRESEDEFARRQLSGLRALMAIADPETTMVPFSGTSVRVNVSDAFERLRSSGAFERVRSTAEHGPSPAAAPAGRVAKVWHFVRSDPMLRNSLYLILNSGVQAALGFVFWALTARVYSSADVGVASTLFSASTFISFFGLLGLNITFLRFLPTARQRNRLITAGVTLVAACSGAIALVYILLTPAVAHPISFVAHSLALVAGFVILTAGAGVNGLTDSVFIAAGKANYNAVIDGVIGGGAKIVFALVLAGEGAYGIFGAASGGLMVAAGVSLLLMVRRSLWRPQFGNFGQLRPMLSYSGANYVGQVLSLLPTVVLPIIVLDRIGATPAAFYYVAFQLANLIYTAAFSVEQAFLVEGSGEGALSRPVLMRSARILLALCVPAFLGALLFGHIILAAYGAKYVSAESALIPMAAAVLPIAAQNWFMTILRLTNQLKAILWGNGVYAFGVIAVAWVMAPRGLAWLSLAWPVGTCAGALVSGISATRTIRRKQQPAEPRRLAGSLR